MRDAEDNRMRRLTGGAAALLCVGLQLSGALHHLLVEHAHCLDHGELTHADAEHGELTHAEGDHAHTQASAPAAGDHPVATRGHRHGSDGHEHCPIASTSRARPGAAAAALTQPTATLERPPVQVPQRAHATAALLSAPKTSPPA